MRLVQAVRVAAAQYGCELIEPSEPICGRQGWYGRPEPIRGKQQPQRLRPIRPPALIRPASARSGRPRAASGLRASLG
eukprot:scaffold57640_cov74-Phaeocystis_antarctica.AAC.1